MKFIVVAAVVWLSLWCPAFGEIHENRSTLCDMSGDNCEKFSFEQFQANGIKTKVNITHLNKSNNTSTVVNTDALVNLISNQENGNLLHVVPYNFIIGWLEG